MAVPYTFGTATSAIPLSQLDSNFATAITIGNTAVQLGNTITTLANVTLSNATVTSLSGPITAAQGGTGLATLTANNVVLGNGTSNVQLVAPGTSGNVLVSNGTTWSSTTVSPAGGGTGLTTLTANNVILGNGTSNVQLVAPGTNGNVLTSNGTTWASTAAGGASAMTLISTLTANNTSQTLQWTGLSGYNNYLLIIDNLRPATAADGFNIQIGYGAGPTWSTAQYCGESIYVNGTTNAVGYGVQSQSADNSNIILGANSIFNGGSGLSGVIHINNFNSAPSNDTTFHLQTMSYLSTTSPYYQYNTGAWALRNNSVAKTAIKIYTNTYNIATGVASLYGISS